MTFEPAPETVSLEIVGQVHEGDDTVVLLAPHKDTFWSDFSASAEFSDGMPDPLDRYSKRIVRKLADDWGGQAVFPSDGPPYPPFIAWALDSGETWSSPVGLLVQKRQGLWLSFRGAIRIPRPLPLPDAARSPCSYCMGPCITACPVMAFASGSYDVAACKAHLDTPEGAECYKGCKVRRACPISQSYGRLEEQSEFHMKAFHPK
jgi:hypothetical protein